MPKGGKRPGSGRPRKAEKTKRQEFRIVVAEKYFQTIKSAMELESGGPLDDKIVLDEIRSGCYRSIHQKVAAADEAFANDLLIF